jgi:cell division protein FtsL
MGLPALRHDSRTASARPHLRLVRPKGKSASVKRRGVSHAAAYQAFVFFAVAVAVIALLGVGRVWLSVQATQASIDSTKLRQEIKNERYKGDLLEVQQSALATPSRILSIATGTLGMAPATSVTYLHLANNATAQAVPTAGGAKASHSVGLVERAMDIAAGEAQVLLVGDVGLSSSR